MIQCAVPKKIHTYPKEGHCKYLGGGGVLKAKILEAKYEAKIEFPGGGGCNTINLQSGGVWILYGTAYPV